MNKKELLGTTIGGFGSIFISKLTYDIKEQNENMTEALFASIMGACIGLLLSNYWLQ